ncbi:MAG: tryptophan 2,3-dioxygenase [Pseudomonadota bacterium]
MTESGSPRDRTAGEAVHTEFDRQMSYGDYLGLDKLLDAQHRLSDQHDEMLFIIIHQVQELWIKQMIHELDEAMDHIRADEPRHAFKALARLSRIQEQMIGAWDVLSTMTPADYLKFRDLLGQSSGFQSYQYRTLEFKLGNKNAAFMKPHRHRPDIHGTLEAALTAPSLYDESLLLMARRGIELPAEVIDRDWSQPYRPHPAVEDAWLAIYRRPDDHWNLYELAEELVDVEDSFQQWRFRHMKTVERIIGHRRGTGGSAGVAYLKTALDQAFFPELWTLRTRL